MQYVRHRQVISNAMMQRRSREGNRVGLDQGLEDRSVRGAPDRYRVTRFDAAAREHWNRSAARRIGQPWSTIDRASRIRP